MDLENEAFSDLHKIGAVAIVSCASENVFFKVPGWNRNSIDNPQNYVYNKITL